MSLHALKILRSRSLSFLLSVSVVVLCWTPWPKRTPPHVMDASRDQLDRVDRSRLVESGGARDDSLS